MRNMLIGGALALPLILAASPALADESATETDVITALGYRPDAHGPSGLMGDHVHAGGEFMVGLTWMHMEHSGANIQGTEAVSDAEIAAAGYTARASDMAMDMAMLHLMWAPNDTLTLTLMPGWTRMEMTMLGIAPPMGGHGGHMLMPGETMTHAVSGIGDTRLGAFVSLSRDPHFAIHGGLTLSIPTGSSSVKNEAGNFVHYGMQPGSGTWDLEPSFTLHGIEESFGWGLQASYLTRLEDANASGFRFGDRFTASAWLAKPVAGSLSLSARLGFTAEGQVEGHYNAAHGHASPPDRQANYGGDVLEAGLGGNLVFGQGLRLGAEATVPLYQDLNGHQLPRDFGVSLSISKLF